MKKLRIGRRRGKTDGLQLSPLEQALFPALADGRWYVPDRFNFTRDVIENLASDRKRRAVTFIGKDGIIEPRTFRNLADRAARWSWLLRERGVRHGDAVLVLAGTNIDWIEVVLACMKVGAVVVPAAPTMSAEALDVRLERTGADLIVAERGAQAEIERATNSPLVLYIDDGRRLLDDVSEEAPTHDSSSRDIGFVFETAGMAGSPKLVGHSHGSTFAARVAAEHWLDAGRGDAVWCPSEPGSAQSVWHALVGPWSRGAEILIHDGPFDARERLDLIYRLGVTVISQTPGEYAALAGLRELARFRPPQLRRLVSTGDWLDPTVAAVFEETWGLTIHDGYGQAETNVVVANGADDGFRPGSLGKPLPGHQVAVIDDDGNELPPGVEGELAVRGRPPTLFAGYWESPEQTKQAFRGDWYATGDVARFDHDGFFWFVARGSDIITSRNERFGPYDAERALRAHRSVVASAIVGVRDLERGGQFVRAFVVLRPGVEGSEQLEAQLRHEVGQALPEHQVPREIEFVDELPTGPGAKVRRLELRERLVVGRPLWEVPPTTEPEHDAWGEMLAPLPGQAAPAEEPVAEALPDYIVPPEPEPEAAPEPAPELEPAQLPAAAAEPVAEITLEPLSEYVVEPLAEPLPPAPTQPDAPAEPTSETAPAAEPEQAAETAGRAPTLDVVPGPEPEPAPQIPHREPEPLIEPERDLPREPLIEPERDLPREPEPEAPRPPELVPQPDVAPQPEPFAPDVRPEPEPELAPDQAAEQTAAIRDVHLEPRPAPKPTAAPLPPAPILPDAPKEPASETAPAAEPEPAAQAAERAPEPVSEVAEQIPEAERVIETEAELAPVVTEPDPDPEPEPVPLPEPDPVPEPEPDPTTAASVDDLIVEPQPYEPPKPVPRAAPSDESRPRVTAESILNPAPPPGPLPDFIVDPEKPHEEAPHIPEPEPASPPLPSLRLTTPQPPADVAPDEPRARLGLPPLSEFPSFTRDEPPKTPESQAQSDEREQAEQPPTGRRRALRGRRAPEPSKRDRRERSASEPGDEETLADWSALSSRLSAYSISNDPPTPPTDESEPDAENEDRREG